MKLIKKKIKLEDLLILFIIICPILDIASYLYRNIFNTNISISTFIRPIISLIVFMYVFIKEKNKNKFKIIVVVIGYVIYAIIHLHIFDKMKMDCSYGTVLHEAQYIVNYSFMILNLFIFSKIFNKENYTKLQNAVLISSSIYIISIYISILTGTSSTTYIEGIGYKGWFESGNSISVILVLSIFIIMSFILNVENKKLRNYTFIVISLIGIYLIMFIGTRVGLLGFCLSILCFISSELFCKVFKRTKINKKVFTILIGVFVLSIILVVLAGSMTIKRRKHLENMEYTIIDESCGEISNLTGDLTVIRNKIINNELQENFMTKAQQQSILDLYNIAKKYNVSNTNTRVQQLIYNCALVKNQKNILLIIFGNGYLINTNELVWEMEFPAFIFNFGIIGLCIYMFPFIGILFRASKNILLNIKKINTSCIMLFLCVGLSFVLSTLSGYTFFNSSSMIIIIIANILLKIKVEILKEENF